MLHRAITTISSTLLPLLAATAVAQEAVDDVELPEIRRYTVEMIIFSYGQNVSAGSEVFMPDEPPPVDPLVDEMAIDAVTGELLSVPAVTVENEPDQVADEFIEPDDIELDDGERPYELVMLAEDEFTLLAAWERLDNLDAYTPLLHFGWTQPTYPEEDTESRPLSSFVTPPEGLEGELKLYLSRYLHLAISLQLDAPAEATPEDSFDDGYDRDFGNSFDDTIVYPVRYRIEEDRIFRNGELRYFDHPKFGALAKITRVEEEPGDEEQLGEELLGFGAE